MSRLGSEVVSRTVLALCATLCAAAFLSGALASNASALTAFSWSGEFAVSGADGLLHHQQKLAVEHSSGRVLRTDVVADRIEVYEPTTTGAELLTTFGVGELSDPYGIAVDQSNGDVYVSDAGNNRIVRYTSDGQPVPTYTLDAGYASPAQGSGAGELGSFAAAIAFDRTSGKLLVADPGNDLVKRFDDSGAYDDFSFDGTGSPSTFTGLQDLAVSATGEIVVLDSDGGDPANGAYSRVERFDSEGVWQETVGPLSGAANVAIRPATGEVVISGNQDAVNRNEYPTARVFDGAVSWPLTLGGQLIYSTVSGLAADAGPGGRVYVATDTSRGDYPIDYGQVSVQVFAVQAPVPPAVLSSAASAMTLSGATLGAKLDTGFADTTYHFEYGLDASYGSQTPAGSVVTSDSPVSVSAQIDGLERGRTYHYRLVLDNGVGGPVAGPDRIFTTVYQPTAATGAVEGVTDTAATLHGSVDNFGIPVTAEFVLTAVSSSDAPSVAVQVGPASGSTPVTATIDGLAPGTIYRYRLLARGATGPVAFGEEGIFTTTGRPDAELVPDTPGSDPDPYRGLVPDAGRTPPSNRFSLPRIARSGGRQIIHVSVPGPGRVTVTGSRVRGRSVAVSTAGRVRIPVTLTRSARRALQRGDGRRLTARVQISYRPSGGAKRSIARRLTFTQGPKGVSR